MLLVLGPLTEGRVRITHRHVRAQPGSAVNSSFTRTILSYSYVLINVASIWAGVDREMGMPALLNRVHIGLEPDRNGDSWSPRRILGVEDPGWSLLEAVFYLYQRSTLSDTY